MSTEAKDTAANLAAVSVCSPENKCTNIQREEQSKIEGKDRDRDPFVDLSNNLQEVDSLFEREKAKSKVAFSGICSVVTDMGQIPTASTSSETAKFIEELKRRLGSNLVDATTSTSTVIDVGQGVMKKLDKSLAHLAKTLAKTSADQDRRLQLLECEAEPALIRRVYWKLKRMVLADLRDANGDVDIEKLYDEALQQAEVGRDGGRAELVMLAACKKVLGECNMQLHDLQVDEEACSFVVNKLAKGSQDLTVVFEKATSTLLEWEGKHARQVALSSEDVKRCLANTNNSISGMTSRYRNAATEEMRRDVLEELFQLLEESPITSRLKRYKHIVKNLLNPSWSPVTHYGKQTRMLSLEAGQQKRDQAHMDKAILLEFFNEEDIC